ncbi:MAG: PPE family protein, SVP subgroup, partial [Mycobacterium sp.]
PYVEWLTEAVATAEQAAGQARAAAAAYDAAFAATVPPALVAANRLQLATLVATNFFGQNTLAIAATEAAYAEMWAQDAAAMYGYAASASAAAALTPFNQPPQTTNPAGQSAQGAAVAQAVGSSAGHSQTTLTQLMSAVPQQLQTLASGAPTTPSAPSTPTSIVTAFSDFNALSGPINPLWSTSYSVFQLANFVTGSRLAEIQAAKLAAKAAKSAVTVEATTPEPGGIRGEVLASVSEADRVGNLSVPKGWAATAPVPAAEPLVVAEPGFRALPAWAATPPTNISRGLPAVGPMTNLAQRRSGNAVFRMRDRRFRMPRPAVGG